MGIIISIGKYGGFWISLKTWSKRISLGWVAITFVPIDADKILKAAGNWNEVQKYAAEHKDVLVQIRGKDLIMDAVSVIEDNRAKEPPMK